MQLTLRRWNNALFELGGRIDGGPIGLLLVGEGRRRSAAGSQGKRVGLARMCGAPRVHVDGGAPVFLRSCGPRRVHLVRLDYLMTNLAVTVRVMLPQVASTLAV